MKSLLFSALFGILASIAATSLLSHAGTCSFTVTYYNNANPVCSGGVASTSSASMPSTSAAACSSHCGTSCQWPGTAGVRFSSCVYTN